jgi:hypothetical protein
MGRREVVEHGRPGYARYVRADGAAPSALRRAAAAVARLLATDLDRQLGPLLRAAGLREVAREAVGLGGAFVVARAEREASGSETGRLRNASQGDDGPPLHAGRAPATAGQVPFRRVRRVAGLCHAPPIPIDAVGIRL